jgi:hypothetical protein
MSNRDIEMKIKCNENKNDISYEPVDVSMLLSRKSDSPWSKKAQGSKISRYRHDVINYMMNSKDPEKK